MNVFKEIMVEFKKNFSAEDIEEKGNTFYEALKSRIEIYEDKIVLDNVTLINYQFHYEGKIYNTQFVTREAFIYGLFLAMIVSESIIRTRDNTSLKEIENSTDNLVITQLVKENILTSETMGYTLMYLLIVLIIKFAREY